MRACVSTDAGVTFVAVVVPPDGTLIAWQRGIATSIDQFAGRGPELGALDGILTAVSTGVRCPVLVSGEAGIGKTRFCREVAVRPERRGFAAARG